MQKYYKINALNEMVEGSFLVDVNGISIIFFNESNFCFNYEKESLKAGLKLEQIELYQLLFDEHIKKIIDKIPNTVKKNCEQCVMYECCRKEAKYSNENIQAIDKILMNLKNEKVDKNDN